MLKPSDEGLPSCTKRRYEVTSNQLPLSCPPRDERIWDAHPRVYLPVEEKGQVTCPYCSTEFVLIAENL